MRLRPETSSFWEVTGFATKLDRLPGDDEHPQAIRSHNEAIGPSIHPIQALREAGISARAQVSGRPLALASCMVIRTNVATNSTTLIQLRLAIHRSVFLVLLHASVRPRLALSSNAATGKPPTPSSPAMPCPVSWVTSKNEAMASPIPATTRNHNPTLPELVLTCDQIAIANAQELTSQDRNISDSTHR